MGLSIYYSGRLRKVEFLPALIEEIKDVSDVYGWKYHVFNTHFPSDTFENHTSFEDVYGICFTPTGCETISFVFLTNGRMVSPDYIDFFAHTENEQYIFNVSVKTQFAGIIIHQLLIQLIKYLNNKYFEDFKLRDESYYWETNDENLMRKQFKMYDDLLDNIELSAQTFPIKPDENVISYFGRLMTHIMNLKKSMSIPPSP